MNWLQVLSNVKKLTLSTRTLARMHEDLSSQMKIQPPWFVRLESFKIKNDPSSKISNEQVHRMEKRVAEYLLQNSPISIVPILRNLLPYSMHDYLGGASSREYPTLGRLNKFEIGTFEKRSSSIYSSLRKTDEAYEEYLSKMLSHLNETTKDTF
ncbi:uncharacterized protein LOC109803158 [Cajanus cajan]|uniref:uncharacterized protein LOC109803158 n=1 Tax=Cajanus cajan TaxID=3821 RepID=UPI0010FBA414|nr:uncharacterized protein LOC109803158 [Cajanus cajan]